MMIIKGKAMSNEELVEFLQKNSLFNGLSIVQLKELAGLVKEIKVNEGDIIIRENEVSDDIYLIKEGEVEVTKYDEIAARSYRLTLLGNGAVIGEIALLDNAPRSATVCATQPTSLIRISINNLQALAVDESLNNKISERTTETQDVMRMTKNEPSPYFLIVKNIASGIGQRIRATNNAVVEGLRRELAHEKARVALGRFIIYTFSVMSFYVILLQGMHEINPAFMTSTVVSVPLIVIFAIVSFFMMKDSGYPMSLFGLTLKNWRKASVEAVLFTVPFLLVVVLYKWILVNFTAGFAGRDIFEIFLPVKHLPLPLAFSFFIAYLVFVPMQEFITRGALQSSLQELLTGKYKIAQAIVLPNVLFGIVHFHLSMGLGAVVAITGLFWGWMYARQGTLVGVILSHLIIGGWALFIVGLE